MDNDQPKSDPPPTSININSKTTPTRRGLAMRNDQRFLGLCHIFINFLFIIDV
jgi:hypothetical protein